MYGCATLYTQNILQLAGIFPSILLVWESNSGHQSWFGIRFHSAGSSVSFNVYFPD